MKDKIKNHFSKDRGYSLLNKTSYSCQYVLIYRRANFFFISGRKNCLDYDISNSITHVYKDAIKEVDLSIPNRSGKKLLLAQNFPLIQAMHRLQCQGWKQEKSLGLAPSTSGCFVFYPLAWASQREDGCLACQELSSGHHSTLSPWRVGPREWTKEI